MNLCSDNHQEICYEGRDCPLCAEKGSHESDVEGYERDVATLKDEIDNLKSQAS